MSEKSKRTVDQIFHDLESLTDMDQELSAEMTGLTFWVLADYKEKFNELQDRTDKKFGVKLKELIYIAIDRAIEK